MGEGWYFGSDIDGGYSYTGAIAEVRFWHGVLDDATILDWHCSALTEAHPAWDALQGHWQLTEGTGTDIGSQQTPSSRARQMERCGKSQNR